MSTGPLNLTEFEEVSFDAIPARAYQAEVYEVELKGTKGGEDAALPKDTPYFNIQFRITEGEYENRRVFGKWIVPPKKIGSKTYEHYKSMNGNLVRMFKSLGYTEEEITSGSFEPDTEDMVGRACTIRVNKYEYDGEWRNNVTGIKPAGEAVSEESSALL